MAQPSPECVLCPACRTHISVDHFVRHYSRSCRYRPMRAQWLNQADAEALLTTLPHVVPQRRRGSGEKLKQGLRRTLDAHYSYKRRLDGQGQYHAPLPPQTTLQTTCRFCGAEAMPGERVCYTCAQGGG
jgi:hypothetical protein